MIRTVHYRFVDQTWVGYGRTSRVPELYRERANFVEKLSLLGFARDVRSNEGNKATSSETIDTIHQLSTLLVGDLVFSAQSRRILACSRGKASTATAISWMPQFMDWVFVI